MGPKAAAQGQRAAGQQKKGHGRRLHLWPPGGHSNSHNLVDLNLHCNRLRPNSQKLEAVNMHNHGKARAWRPLQIMLVHPAAAGNNKSL